MLLARRMGHCKRLIARQVKQLLTSPVKPARTLYQQALASYKQQRRRRSSLLDRIHTAVRGMIPSGADSVNPPPGHASAVSNDAAASSAGAAASALRARAVAEAIQHGGVSR